MFSGGALLFCPLKSSQMPAGQCVSGRAVFCRSGRPGCRAPGGAFVNFAPESDACHGGARSSLLRIFHFAITVVFLVENRRIDYACKCLDKTISSGRNSPQEVIRATKYLRKSTLAFTRASYTHRTRVESREQDACRAWELLPRCSPHWTEGR